MKCCESSIGPICNHRRLYQFWSIDGQEMIFTPAAPIFDDVWQANGRVKVLEDVTDNYDEKYRVQNLETGEVTIAFGDEIALPD